MDKQFGILLKVGASGLENIEQLSVGLKHAGVDTTALDARAEQLQAQLKTLNATTGSVATETKESAAADRVAAAEAAKLAQAVNALESEYRQQALAAAAAATEQLKTGTAAAASAGKQTAANAEVRGGLQLISAELQRVQNLVGLALGGSVAFGLARDLAQTADAYANLAARIELTTGKGAGFNAAFNGIFEVAKRTNSSLEETGNLFTKLAEAGKALGVSQQQALQLTETINQATQLSGASAESSKAAITQLVQGLGSGVLRGDEFNSVMEQSPRLAKALADGLGTTTGELRKLAEAGALTSESVIKSLQGQSRVLQEEFASLPPTVGRALQNLSTEWTRYVGEVDQANGVSSKAAAAIGLVANNLDQLATALKVAVEVWAAYKALGIAQTMFAEQQALRAAAIAAEQEALATTAATAAKVQKSAATRTAAVATEADTLAIVANTAATRANVVATEAGTIATKGAEAARAGVLATLGRFAGMAGLAVTGVALFGDTAVSAFKAAGTWIGQAAAKLAGYKDRGDEVLAMQKASDEAARKQAQAMAELSQQTALAAAKAQGLSAESRKLIADFDDARTKGETVAEALDKVAKGLRLDDLSGIKSAVTALDALAQQGKVTADQIGRALGDAFKGIDLGIFETQARAMFDSSEQGARRLQSVLDAIANESLKRAGTSAQELRTGFSQAASAAINDLDALNATVKKLGVNSDETKRALASSLDQALAAATTERAVKAVIERLQSMGKEGLIAGDYLREGMQKALDKIDKLTAGTVGLREAAQKAGVDFDQLSSGISKVSADGARAMADLVAQVSASGIAAERASPLLAEALNKRVQAAQTKEEIDLLRQQIDKAAVAGKLFGADLTEALVAVKTKAEQLSPAFRQAAADAKLLGVDLQGATKVSPEDGIRAFERLKASGKATAEEVQQAFINLANQQIKAANGVVPEWVKVEAELRGAVLTADNFGTVTVKSAKDAASALGNLETAADSVGNALDSASAKATNLSAQVQKTTTIAGKALVSSTRTGSAGSALPGAGLPTTVGGTVQAPPPPDNSGDWEWRVDIHGSNWQMTRAGAERRYAEDVAKKKAEAAAKAAAEAAAHDAWVKEKTALDAAAAEAQAAALAAASPTGASTSASSEKASGEISTSGAAPGPTGTAVLQVLGMYEIKFTATSGQTAAAYVPAIPDADRLRALLQEQFRQAGGG